MTIRKFRKRPVVIEALQYLPHTNCREVAEFIGVEWDREECDPFSNDQTWSIATLEGVMDASPGDFIIKGISGEFYPCKPEIFEQTYEEVENEDD